MCVGNDLSFVFDFTAHEFSNGKMFIVKYFQIHSIEIAVQHNHGVLIIWRWTLKFIFFYKYINLWVLSMSNLPSPIGITWDFVIL
jgi:hypothetical protein